ncbi:MAG: T9SS type A sorting domain-containing protein [Bacteroidetes bacterium]|nr:T9SS type A sorting domain-containing protein [Bacteroidota bacterium]
MRHFPFVLFLCIGSAAFAQQGNTVKSTTTNDSWDFIGVNNMLLWVSNNGRLAYDPLTGGPGLEWPRGSGHSVAFTQGLVWGGVVQGNPRVGGATYRGGWQAGVILPDGSADDPSKPEHRIYRAHRYDAAWWNNLPATERERLLRDLREWPAQHGAPWVDANANGVYDPDTTLWMQGGVTDAPAMRGNEMLWFACNDLDDRRSRELYGSPSVGMEMHTLVWASAGHPLLDNVVFREHTLINKGTETVENMAIAMWEDGDLGEGFDDYCGMDTTLGMAYIYNGVARDQEYGVPPAAGTVWLQTPVIPQAGSTARFGDELREDHANLPLSAYVFYISSSGIYREPALSEPQGAIMMMFNMDGRFWNNSEQVDPTTGDRVPISLAGDPLREIGWRDGIIHAPGDRRFLSSSRGFDLAPGDTQKVILASIATDGGNHLLSVRDLRHKGRQLQDMFRNLPIGAVTAPVFTSDISHPAGDDAYEVQVSGGPFSPGTSAVHTVLRDPSGVELQREAMLDDGQHGDGAAGDGIFGALLSGSGVSTGADLSVLTTDGDGTKEWFVDGELPLPGPANVQFTDVYLDSPKPDGALQPGEYARFGIRLENGTTETLGGWKLFFRGESSLALDRVVQHYWLDIAAGGEYETQYDPASPGSFIGIDVPDTIGAGPLHIPVTIMSDRHCVWHRELTLDIDSLPVVSPHGYLKHVEGWASGTLGYTIVDPAALTDHDYRVSIEGEDFGEKSMHIEDVTLGQTLFRDVNIPGKYVPLSTEIDGWCLTLGTAFDEPVYDTQGNRLSSFTHPFEGVFSAPERSWFTLYEQGSTAADAFQYGSGATQYDLLPVRLVFDRTSGQKALQYLRGSRPTNYAFTGYWDVPVRAYDISDTSRPRQLMVGFSEQLNAAGNDSSYMPTRDLNDREFLIIFTDDYEPDAPEKFRRPLRDLAPEEKLLYIIWAVRDTTQPMFENGDAYVITPRVPVSNRDVYILEKPKLLDVHHGAEPPARFALHAVYPNPVGTGSGSGTTTAMITFDAHRSGTVRLSAYDMLGRRAAHTAEEFVTTGTYRISYDCTGLRSGTYLLSLDLAGQRATRLITVVQ